MKLDRWMRQLAVSACLLALTSAAHATDVATKPLRADLLTKPNVIFGLDNSGSMDAEILLYAVDGFLWWNFDAGTGWGVDPAHPDRALRGAVSTWFNAGGVRTPTWRAYIYLFPNGVGDGNRRNYDGEQGFFAAPPTAQFAFLRSPQYNTSYYDPNVTYRPWLPGHVSSGPVTFADATPSAVRSHPVLQGTDGSVIDLTRAVPADTRDNTVFTALPGVIVPPGSRKSVCDAANTSCAAWTPVTVAETVPANTVVRVSMPYFPATYWMREACIVVPVSNPGGEACVRAPDGATLKRYEIRAGRSFPSGRSHADELQNFANWFQYYRKRKLLLSSSMGESLSGISGLRMGITTFHWRPASVTLYDSDSPSSDSNVQKVLGAVYENNTSLDTPTRETLDYIGRQFRRTDRAPDGEFNVVQSSCQRNNAFILTDGFANASRVALPAWDSGKGAGTWGTGAPYERTYEGSLADLALRYYTNNPRPDLPRDALPPTGRDRNRDLHVNTYGLTLGARGLMLTNDGVAPPTQASDWLDPDAEHSPIAIDDLWHATLNGRGQMYLAHNSQQLAERVRSGLLDILEQVGSQSAVSVGTVNLRRGDGRVYRAGYNPRGFSGDVTAHPIGAGDAAVGEQVIWSAAQRLASRDWRTRVIASHDGLRGQPFTPAAVGTAAGSTDPRLFDYLRGKRSDEGGLYRARAALVGAINSARPVVSQADGVVYAASGEGMLHAFDTDSGDELWAYVPHAALPGMVASAERTWSFRPLLDGSPVLAEANGRQLLVAGRGVAGPGFFALDVTQPRGLTATSLATRALWEFPNATTPAHVRASLGLSMGRPVVVKTKADGWVVLVTAGYNNAVKDGKARLFVLDAFSGRLVRSLEADADSSGTDPGFAHLSVMREGSDPARYAYGGDERGNLWRFDLESVASGSVSRLARLRDANGRAQPVTAAPELTRIGGQRIVLVGTGRLLGWSDFGSDTVQSFYAIKDGAAIDNPRNTLAARRLDATEGNADLVGDAFAWEGGRGWYVDFPAGQQANTDPAIAMGAVAFTTNKTQKLSCGEWSYLYLVDIATGTGVPGNDGAMMALAPRTASAVVVMGTDGSTRGVRTVGNVTGSDGRVVRRNLVLPLAVPPRKNGWLQLVGTR